MAKGSRLHSATRVHVGDQSADIDKGLVRLITQVWKAGVQTDGSCEEGEGTPGYAWIGFSSAEHLEAFLSLLLLEADGGSLMRRMVGVYQKPNDERTYQWGEEPAWMYFASIHMVIDEAKKQTLSASISFRYGAAFPSADIKDLTRLLQNHNQRQKKGLAKAKAGSTKKEAPDDSEALPTRRQAS